MTTTNQALTATVTPDQGLDLPPEIRAQLIPGETYNVTVENNTITLAKSPVLTWDLVRAKHQESGEELTDEIMEEICELVREVRRENRLQRESETPC
jgi:hypothetical protein